MDTNGASLIKLVDEVVDITLLRNVKLIPLKEGKVIIKELPREPMVECSKNGCDEMADYLVQFVGDDLTFIHSTTCFVHVDEVVKLIQ